MEVEVKINESKMDKLEIGLPATVQVEGIPNEQFAGKVTKIGVLAEAQSRWLNPNLKEYTNKITLDKTHPDFKPDMTAEADILITRLEDVLAVPVQSVYSKGSHTYVFLPDADPAYKEVKTGLASTEYVEIKEGLEVGDQVGLAITDDMKRLLPAEDIGADEKAKPFPEAILFGADRNGNKTAKPGKTKRGSNRAGAGAKRRKPGAKATDAAGRSATSKPKTRTSG
jgi:hypothetical protein